MIDYKGRVESYSREMLRKESQIKELQTRMETGDGCKYQNIVSKIQMSCREFSINSNFLFPFSFKSY